MTTQNNLMMAMDSTMPIDVVAGVIRDVEGRILVSKRPPGSHLENCWEFPGGKLEPGESHAAALKRELEEEVGIRTTQSRPLVSVTHHYPDKTIRLWLFYVSSYIGEARGLEGQKLQWVKLKDLPRLDMPAADRPLVKVLPLGGQYAVSLDPSSFKHVHDFLWRWKACLQSGVRLIRLRTEGDSLRHMSRWIPEIESITRQFGATWLVSGRLEDCLNCPADGVHLDRHQLAMLTRRPIGKDRLLAASCHDQAEIDKAASIRSDFIVVSPVLSTASQPEASVLGWPALAKLVSASPLPVYAQGGMQPTDLQQARELGAFGVAGIKSFGWSK